MPTVGRMQDEQQQHTIQEQQVCEGWGGGLQQKPHVSGCGHENTLMVMDRRAQLVFLVAAV